VFPLEYNFDSKAKRLCEARTYLFEACSSNQIVASVKIKIATVETVESSLNPPPSPEKKHPRSQPTKKARAGNLSSKKVPAEAVIVKKIPIS